MATKPEETATMDGVHPCIHESATVQVLSVYSCPKEGCIRVFQRHAALEIHLFYEQCSKEAERGKTGICHEVDGGDRRYADIASSP